MKKLITLCVVCLFCIQQLSAQNPFPITLSPSSNFITCNQPVNCVAAVPYSVAQMSYTWAGPGATYYGQQVNISVQGPYTVTGTGVSVLTGVVQTATTHISIGTHTAAPTINITPNTQTMSCAAGSSPTVDIFIGYSSLAGNDYYKILTPYGGVYADPIYFYYQDYIPQSPGVYTCMASVGGCESQQTFTVTSTQAFPSFSLSSPQNFSAGCNAGASITVNITNTVSPSNGSLSYTVIDVATSSYTTGGAQTFSISPGFTFPGAQNFTAIVHDNVTGCEAQAPFYINIENYEPQFYITGVLANCSAQSRLCTFYPLQPGMSLSWILPGGIPHPYDTLTIPPTPVVTATVTDTYTVHITYGTQCVQDWPFTFEQNIFPPYVASSPSMGTVSCTSHTIQLHNNSLTGIPFTSNLPNNLPVISAWTAPSQTPVVSPSFTAPAAGIYTLTVLDLNNGCTSHTTITITDTGIYPLVSPPAQPYYLCGQPSVTLSPVITGNVSDYTYAWLTPSAAVVSGTTAMNLTVSTLGTYTVIVTSSAGCSSQAQLEVSSCVGLKENKRDPGLMIYPNPCQENVNMEAAGSREITITNLVGEIILKVQLNAGKNEVNLGAVSPGIYFIRPTNNMEAGAYKLLRE